MNVSLLSRLNAQEWNCWLLGVSYVFSCWPESLYNISLKKLPHCFPNCLYHFMSPTSNMWLIQFLCISPSIWCCHSFLILAILVGLLWYVIVVFICTSVIANNVERLFLFFFAICTFSSLKCLFTSLVHIWSVGSFAFLLLCFEGSLYILDTGVLSDLWFANIFSHSIACLSILSAGCFTEPTFKILMKTDLSVISFMGQIQEQFHFFLSDPYVFYFLIAITRTSSICSVRVVSGDVLTVFSS